MAKELIEVGVDINSAPILDLDGESHIIGRLDRALHLDPKAVTCLVRAFIEGMHAAGMPSTGKHFPGHGQIKLDSHIAKPTSNGSMEEIMASDLIPYQELIKTNELDAIMPAHVTYTKVDADNMATYSSIWLNDILREQLAYKNIIISDCLSMQGADVGDLKSRSCQAINASCDMLIVVNQSREALLDLFKSKLPNINDESKLRVEKFIQKLPCCTKPTNVINKANLPSYTLAVSKSQDSKNIQSSSFNKNFTV